MSEGIVEFDNTRCTALSKRANIRRSFARIVVADPDSTNLKGGPMKGHFDS
jgi:hypothetical protein